MSTWHHLLTEAVPHGHLLQFYKADEPLLTRNVSQYLFEGWKRGESLLVIATPEHRRSFLREFRRVGIYPGRASVDGRLVLLDAAATLSRFMVNGEPDQNLFEAAIKGAVPKASTQPGSARLRAYGEMVGLLWQAGQFAAAIRLEELWNHLVGTIGCQLFCGYPIDIFSGDFQTADVEAVMRAHTHVIPTGDNGDVHIAFERAMDDLPELDTVRLRSVMKSAEPPRGVVMPGAEAAIRSLGRVPEGTGELLSRARHHYDNEKRFRALVENASDVICLVNPRGKVLYASASTEHVLGYMPQDIVERSGFELIHPDDKQRVRKAFRQALGRPRTPIQWEARVQRKDGEWRCLECTSSNLLAEPAIGAVVLNYRDITERKASEEALRQHAADLARSNGELQAFAYAAAHDLKEPLRTVCAFTQLLVQRSPKDDESAEFAGFIVDSVTRMSTLLDDLLSFTSLDLSERQDRVPLGPAAEQAIRNLQQRIDESRARITLDPLPLIEGRESHVIELFQNLFANAIKYRSEAPIEIHVGAVPCGPEWVIRVRDNGIGIRPEYHDHIFGLFKRLHARDVPGTGIGLAICRKIAQSMGGRIWVESQPGEGSTFCFSVRAVPESD